MGVWVKTERCATTPQLTKTYLAIPIITTTALPFIMELPDPHDEFDTQECHTSASQVTFGDQTAASTTVVVVGRAPSPRSSDLTSDSKAPHAGVDGYCRAGKSPLGSRQRRRRGGNHPGLGEVEAHAAGLQPPRQDVEGPLGTLSSLSRPGMDPDHPDVDGSSGSGCWAPRLRAVLRGRANTSHGQGRRP